MSQESPDPPNDWASLLEAIYHGFDRIKLGLGTQVRWKDPFTVTELVEELEKKAGVTHGHSSFCIAKQFHITCMPTLQHQNGGGATYSQLTQDVHAPVTRERVLAVLKEEMKVGASLCDAKLLADLLACFVPACLPSFHSLPYLLTSPVFYAGEAHN